MGGCKYHILVISLVLLLFLPLISAEEWRHPDCPKDFDEYKGEYGIPRHEFENLLSVCYMSYEIYRYRERLEELRKQETHLPEEVDYKELTAKAKEQITEWAKNPPPKPKRNGPQPEVPPTPPPSMGSKPEEFGRWISVSLIKSRLASRQNKIWWKEAKSWKEQTNITDKASVYYYIQNFKNKIIGKIKIGKLFV